MGPASLGSSFLTHVKQKRAHTIGVLKCGNDIIFLVTCNACPGIGAFNCDRKSLCIWPPSQDRFNKLSLAPPCLEVAPAQARASGVLCSRWVPGDAAGGQWGMREPASPVAYETRSSQETRLVRARHPVCAMHLRCACSRGFHWRRSTCAPSL